jgi:hypothetical protein
MPNVEGGRFDGDNDPRGSAFAHAASRALDPTPHATARHAMRPPPR